jgi:methionyl-tRNA formyltransferase
LWRRVNFGPIDSFVFFGGGPLLVDAATRSARRGLRTAVFTSPRHLAEITPSDALQTAGVPTFEADDINADPRLSDHVANTTLGIALGPAWIFGPEVCALFGPRFVNVMGIDLPRYRGGAHHTWQILQGNRVGSVNLQLINEVVDSGPVIKRREYLFPASARVPADYFRAAEPENRDFLFEFLDEVIAQVEFREEPLQEKLAQHYPSLSTDVQGWVDWSWDVDEIEQFVNAFGEPYPGASTHYGDTRVHLKEARVERGDGPFHPFMAGLVYRVSDVGAWVCCRGGSLLVEQVTDEAGAWVTVRVGRRFHTPRDLLDAALAYRAVYTAKGLK